ncbi:hypothetical protein ACFV2H_14205 [Streptomyces sp. NPDC059629]|uniref:hypothetical protein n=1 Tax=Streptomyces sp. NPDC059629 TaxID=3346889 RepID=UPI00369813D1
MARTDDVRECSITWTVETVGSKWPLLAMREPLLGTHRFDEIAQHTGASRDILTARPRGPGRTRAGWSTGSTPPQASACGCSATRNGPDPDLTDYQAAVRVGGRLAGTYTRVTPR